MVTFELTLVAAMEVLYIWPDLLPFRYSIGNLLSSLWVTIFFNIASRVESSSGDKTPKYSSSFISANFARAGTILMAEVVN